MRVWVAIFKCEMSGGIVKTEKIGHFFTLVQETHALSIYICWLDTFAPTILLLQRKIELKTIGIGTIKDWQSMTYN